MSYYMGDYYYGTRRGDPGFLSFLGGLAKGAVGAIPGVGPILSGALSGIGHAAPAAAGMATAAVTKPGFYSGATKVVSTVKGAVLKHPVLTGAGAAGIVGVAAGAGAAKVLSGGDRKCKHFYPSGKCRRRMRVTNPKALRRAIRRTTGFAKLAMRTIHIVHPKKKGRFGGFRRKRKA